MNKPPPPARRPLTPGASQYPPVLGEERELILTALAQLEGRMLGRLSDIEATQAAHAGRLLDVERAVVEQRGLVTEVRGISNEFRSLSSDVRQLLHRDVSQEQRITTLWEAREAGREAGQEAAKKPSAANAVIALLISSIVAGLVQAGKEIIESKHRAETPPALEQRRND